MGWCCNVSSMSTLRAACLAAVRMRDSTHRAASNDKVGAMRRARSIRFAVAVTLALGTGCGWVAGTSSRELASCDVGALRCVADKRQACVDRDGTPEWQDAPCGAEAPLCRLTGQCAEC